MQVKLLPDLKKNISLVTGSSSGIGASIAIELSQISKHIYIIGRDISNLEKTNDLIIENNCECTIVPLDITKNNVVENLSSQIYEKHKKLDIFISTAGIINNLSPITSIQIDEFKKLIELNFVSNIKMLKYFHPLLKSSEKGKIVIISSDRKILNEPFWGGFSPIMNALNETVMIYAKENENDNISTNIVCPVAVDTNFRNIFMPGEDKSKIMTALEFSKKLIPMINNEFNSNGKIYFI